MFNMLVQERMRGPHGRGTVGVRVSRTWGEGYGSQELRGEGVTVSGTRGEGYEGHKLGARVSGTLVKNYGSQEFVIRAR
jgi:hypothetical protein